MYRYLVLAAAVLMQMCLGATYSWNVFVEPLKALVPGLSQGAAQFPFTAFYIAFPATMVGAGMLLSRLGPRFCACAGGALFGTGWMLAALGRHSFILTILGIGLVGGIGVGLAYIVPLAVCIQWFPRHKGLVTGIAVAGFGGGAAMVTKISGALIRLFEMSPFSVFFCLGILFALLVGGAGLFMIRPKSIESNLSSSLRLRGVLTQPSFLVLYAAMFSGLAAGFTVNANLKQLMPAAGTAVGVSAVAWFAIANAAGRITWGFLYDRIPAKLALSGNLLLQAALLLSAVAMLKSEFGLLFFAAAAGFNYGGVLVMYAASTARLWGAQNVGPVYGWLFSANIPAALAPVLAGLAYDRLQSFALPLNTITVLTIAGALLILFRSNIASDNHQTTPNL